LKLEFKKQYKNARMNKAIHIILAEDFSLFVKLTLINSAMKIQTCVVAAFFFFFFFFWITV
jgi:hypothetical protein